MDNLVFALIAVGAYRRGVTMGMDEWGRPLPICDCLLVVKAREMQAAIKANCVECQSNPLEVEKVAVDCTRCVFLKFN